MTTAMTSDGSRLPSRPKANRVVRAKVIRSRSPIIPMPTETTAMTREMAREMSTACQNPKYRPMV